MAQCPTCGDTFKSESGVKIHHKRIHDESIAGVESECLYCGETFRHGSNETGNYCSRDCYGNDLESRYEGESNPNGTDRVTLTCPICNCDFEVQKHQADRRICCSAECDAERRSERQTGKAHHNYVERITVACETCGDDLERLECRVNPYDNQFCDKDCYGVWISENQSGEQHYKFKPDELTEYGKGWNEQKREAVRERDNRKCQSCGDGATGHFDKLDVHHIQPADSFNDSEKRNAMENLISLCRECHPKWEKMAPLRPDNQ